MTKNTVKIVCPQCNGTGRGCDGNDYVTEDIDGEVGINEFEKSYCEGNGWLWATRWEDR